VPYAKVNSSSNLELQLPFGPNWAVLILPYIEQNDLYLVAKVSSYPGIPITVGRVPPYASVNESWRVIRGVEIKSYLCPSDQYNRIPYNDPGAIELDKHRADQLQGRFDAEHSPFVYEVDGRTAEIVIDLDQPPKAA
jgi:hypothetical protein